MTALTLQQHLDQGYAHDSGLVRQDVDPATSLAQAGFAKSELLARLAQLDAVTDRCVISRIWRDVLQRAISQIG